MLYNQQQEQGTSRTQKAGNIYRYPHIKAEPHGLIHVQALSYLTTVFLYARMTIS